MGSSRMIATRKRGVFMAHICSECGFPMITVVQIEAEAQKTYTFMQSKAEQIASETAENAIREEIRNIESCYNTKQPLVGKHKGSGMISPGHFCTSSFSGFVSQCPKCLNVEPWKSATSSKSMDELNRDNFPTVFVDADEAENWAFDKVKDMTAAIDEKRKDEATVKEAVEKVIDAKIKINAWTKELNSVPETADRDKLKSELADSEKLKSQLGIFDLKNKKTVNEKIKILKLQIKDLNDIIERKETPIARKIVTLGNKLLTIQSIAFGYSTDVSSTKYGNAFSYFLSPNDIPDEILSKIDALDTDKIEVAAQVQNEDFQESEASYNKPSFCRKCGFKLLTDSTFCTKCGTKVE